MWIMMYTKKNKQSGKGVPILWPSPTRWACLGVNFRIPYHFLHSLCKCMGHSLKVHIEKCNGRVMLKVLPCVFKVISTKGLNCVNALNKYGFIIIMYYLFISKGNYLLWQYVRNHNGTHDGDWPFEQKANSAMSFVHLKCV